MLRRGSGEILIEQEDAILVRDRVSEAYMLACEDTAVGFSLLDRYFGQDCDLLMVSGYSLGIAAAKRYGFSDKLECFQAAYFGEKPSDKAGLSFRTAEEQDLKMLTENYRLISPEELEKVVERRSVLLGYFQGRLIGFVGEHLEGSMGILYVFPEHRHRGFGTSLQTHLIVKTMEKGYIPFGQVEKENLASLNLQKKIGMLWFL